MTHDADTRDRQDDKFRKAFALVLVAIFSALFARLIAPFIEALLLAIVLSGLIYPLYKRLEPLLFHRVAAAAITTLLVLLAVVLPLLLVISAFARQAIQLSRDLVAWIEQQADSARVAFEWPNWLPFAQQIDLNERMRQLADVLSGTSSFFVDGLGTITQTTFVFLLQLLIMLYTMFYLLLAGPRLMAVFDYTPLTEADKRLIAERGVSITRATLKGTVVIGVLQGTLAGAAFAVVGIPAPMVWGVVMTILSAVPGVGAALVWIPAVGALLFTGEIAAGIGLGLWCTFVVSTADNLVRPYLVGNDTQMPAVLILLSTLGGIAMFGVAGIIIGPLLAGFFLTSWHIFAAAFRRELDDSEGAPPLADPDGSASGNIVVGGSADDLASASWASASPQGRDATRG